MEPTQKQLAGRAGWTPERRAAQAARAKMMAVKAKQSVSQPLSGSENSSAPSMLPPSAANPANPTNPTNPTNQTTKAKLNDPLQGVLDKLESLAKRDEKPPPKERKKLPADAQQRKNELSVYQVPARGPVMGLQALFDALDWDSMTDQEYEANVDAWAALFWYYGLDHPIVGVALVTMGTVAPRVTKAVVNRRRKKKGMQPLPKANGGMELEPEPGVQKQ